MSRANPPVAVVSGGSSGIGRALVAQLHGEGWAVHACGRDVRKLQQLERDFPGVRTAACDVTDRQAVRAFARSVQAASPVDVTADLRVNTEGAIHLIAEFLPALRHASRASILIVSSGYALAPATRAPIYSASKAALHSLAKSLRRQLAPLSIGVTELLPPVVDTPSVAHRRVSKLAAGAVARAALAGVRAGALEVRPGKTKLPPLLLRLLPGTAERIVAKT
jgi:uncharacterized oxidoreductase